MAEDLEVGSKTTRDPVYGSALKVGQFWRDTVNTDILKILEIDESFPIYVRCACYPRGEYYMGIQEMRASHLAGERFVKVGWVKSLWYRWKLRQ